MEQVSKFKQSHQAMLDQFDQLAKQMALLISKSNSSSKNAQSEVMNPAWQHDEHTWCSCWGGPPNCMSR